MHYLLKQFIPQIVHTLRWYSFKYGWKGDYDNFETANRHAEGYNAQEILERIKETTRKVVNNEVVYERDGIIYETPKMNFSMLTSLLWVASKNDKRLTVLDFGGSLGTTYNSKKKYLDAIPNLQWCIVEQPNYVEAGRKEFENDQLHFYYSIEECLQYHKPDIIIISGVIQYIEKTYELLDQMRMSGVKYLYIDTIAFNDEDRDRITIQNVPPEFYGIPASYTCWFYSKPTFFNYMKKNYNLLFEFIVDPDKYYLQLKPWNYEGQFWELK